jgi:hypothetical protein
LDTTLRASLAAAALGVEALAEVESKVGKRFII